MANNNWQHSYPSLENISDFSLKNEAAIATSLGSGWSMKLANILEYDNAPAIGIKKPILIFCVGFNTHFKPKNINSPGECQHEHA